MKSTAIEQLKRLTGKRYVYLTQRGNKSILLALKAVKSLGAKKVIIGDQGGWITYLQYPDRLHLNLIKIKTELGIIEPNELSGNLDEKSVLLVNSLSGYFAEQPMGLISAICKQKNALLINDATGTIGTELAKFGDIIIGSFGDSKPINLSYGGFIAYDDNTLTEKIGLDEVFDTDKLPLLVKKLQNLPERLRELEKHSLQIKKDLADLKIIHPDKKGINVVIAFKDKFEMERIINYCHKFDYEYTECPRFIRVNIDAISIEVKRK